MAVDRRLLKLHEALRRCSSRPPNRIVTMVARVTPALEVGIRDLPALDRSADTGRTGVPTWIGGARLKSSRGTQVRRPICVDMGMEPRRGAIFRVHAGSRIYQCRD